MSEAVESFLGEDSQTSMNGDTIDGFAPSETSQEGQSVCDSTQIVVGDIGVGCEIQTDNAISGIEKTDITFPDSSSALGEKQSDVHQNSRAEVQKSSGGNISNSEIDSSLSGNINADDEKCTEKQPSGDWTNTNKVMTSGNEESQSSVEEQSAETQNCYCGKERNLSIVELQCGGCFKWFHENCISVNIGKCVPFMTYYTFYCKACNPSGTENFSKKQPSFSQMCSTAIANLMQQSCVEGHPRTLFSKDKEVIPYIEAKWEYLTVMQRRIKQTWHNTVHKSVLKDNDIFICEEKSLDGDFPLYGLVNQDLNKIAPSYETMGRGGQMKLSQDSSSSQSALSFSSGKGRSSKRRFVGDGQLSGVGKKVKSDLVMPKLPPNGYPLEHPFNKDGYRYILAEPDPHAPFRQEFDESQDWAGKPIPGWLYRKLTPNYVLLAMHDRAPQLRISEDRLSVTGEKGYCMVRASHGVNRGTWYFECTIQEMSEGLATRLGWSQGLGNLQAPLGYDKFSYSWRSRKGTKFHECRGYHYNFHSYGAGDTLGFLIHLPPTSENVPLPAVYKDKPLVKFKSYLYYEEKDEVQQELKALAPLPGSKIVFYKNGQNLGTAFENIYGGTYYPAISLYKSCTVTMNFGPKFKHPPMEEFKGMYQAAHEAIIEQTMTDLLFFTENKGKLRLDNI